MEYSSKYRIGQEVTLKSPLIKGIIGIVDGIRYDVLIDDSYNIERIFPDLLSGESNVTQYLDALEINDEE